MFAQLAQTTLGLAPVVDDSGPQVPLGEFLPAGTVVGRYRLAGMLGRGGMGVVYEADDPQLGRAVALKVLRTQLGDSSEVRLLAEARAMAGVSHPNVCAVYDVGRIDGRHYLAMECIRSGTLGDWLQRRRRSLGEIVRAFVAAGRGLAAAHAIGVVHRDFKPANVLVDDGGRVVVCDFGLAVSERDVARPRGGTPRYMPPEQRDGGGDDRVDQYAFAVALADALSKHRVSRRLRAVIDRARDPQPQSRYPTMRGLLAALEREAAPRSRRSVFGAGATATVTVLALLGVLARSVPSAADAPPESPPGAPEVQPAVDALMHAALAHAASGEHDEMLALIKLASDEAHARGDLAGVAYVKRYRGTQLGKLGRLDEAIAELEDAFYMGRQIGRDDIAADAAIVLVGLRAGELGDPRGALAWGRHAEGALDRLVELDARVRADFDDVMGRAHKAMGQLSEARQRFVRSVATLRAVSPEFDLDLPIKLGALAGAERELGDLESARRHVQEAIDIGVETSGPLDVNVGALIGSLGGILVELGQDEAGLRTLGEGRRIVVASYGEQHSIVVGIDASRASALMKLQRYDEAMTLLDETLSRAPLGSPFRCEVLERQAATAARRHRCVDARARYVVAIDCWEDVFGPGTPHVERAYEGRAVCAKPGPISAAG